MYNSEDYLNYNDLNAIENKIEELTNYLNNNQRATIPTFMKKQWIVNEFPYVQEIDRIEKGIDNLGLGLFKTSEWITTRKWIINVSNSKQSFDYKDINRWINNLNLIDKNKENNFNIWNGQSFINWNENSNYEWEEF
jgi:hypothetical protein